ncbi:uncharacterized protein LOC123293152 [Chrysoperla carnea]|uniref:uncharacterized protein LOC123293152 n=1 Tax=Chrysoperla carnea TaxID=189513 RepID=UPI001D090977|nr:uncharacterized protein LOC123293152 [Chrysoperla carnea]
MNWRVSSCCCFSLRTGTLILGYLSLIGSVLGTIGSIIILSNTKKFVEDSLEETKTTQQLTPEQLDAVVLVVQITAIVCLVVALIGGLISVLLLMGVYKEKPGLIKISVIVSVIGCVLTGLSCILYLIGSFASAAAFGNFISSLIGLALNVYFTMVIHSYRLELLEGGGRKRDSPNLPRQF